MAETRHHGRPGTGGWSSPSLPYDQVDFYGTGDNPELLFIELIPTRFSVHNGNPATPPRRWTRVVP